MNKKEYFHFVPLTLLRQINSPQEYENKSVSVSKPSDDYVYEMNKDIENIELNTNGNMNVNGLGSEESYISNNNNSNRVPRNISLNSNSNINSTGKSNTTKLHPFSRKVIGTVLFADISGFTKLSTKLSSERLKVHIK